MTLSELSIKRHVLAYMFGLLFIILGFLGYKKIGIDKYPDVDFPIIVVNTTMKGANPDVVDASITNIIEEKVNSISGIDYIKSTSATGVSTVVINFLLEKDVEVAFNEVKAKVDQALRELPRDADAPIVNKIDSTSSAIMWLALTGDRTLPQLNNYANTVLKKKLETISGVGEVKLGGLRARNIRIELNATKMAGYKIAISDIKNAITNEHRMYPGGFLTAQKSEYMLKLDTEYHSVDELRQLIVNKGPSHIRLKDIATVKDDLEDDRKSAKLNGEYTVGLGIVKVKGGNSVEIINSVKERLDSEIVPLLPQGIKLQIASDDSTFIKNMVFALKEHLILGTILTAFIVWFFLTSVRSTIIIAIAIPVSLFGAIAVISLFGYTLNKMTLLALLLLIGVVVDDAIVVLENIYRHLEMGKDRLRAAFDGGNQVFFAVLAATLSLVAIFGPVMFMGGMVGRFFKSFAVVVTFGVLVSFFVSLTLTPMLCSRFLTKNESQNRVYKYIDSVFSSLEQSYKKSLVFVLKHRYKVLIATFVSLLVSFIPFANIGKGFVPYEDSGKFLIYAKSPLGSNINYMQEKLTVIESHLKNYPEVQTVYSTIGSEGNLLVSESYTVVTLIDKSERRRGQQEIVASLQKELNTIAGVESFVSEAPMFGGGRGEKLQFSLKGPSLSEVVKYSQELQKKLREDTTLGKMDIDMNLNLPQLKLVPDRAKITASGLSTSEVIDSVNIMTGGAIVAKYNDEPGDGQRYDIRLKGDESDFSDIKDLKKIYLKTPAGELIRLDELIRVEPVLGAATVMRSSLEYSANFYSDPSKPIGDAIAKINVVATDILPKGYNLEFVGQAKEFKRTAATMAITFGMALVLLYIVLASQFNSFIQPLVVMLAQPVAIVGGIFGLYACSQTLNIFSMIGLVLLIGLVAKNSILLVDLTNQLRSEGRGVDEALIEACPIRMRPVLMTSATIILAMLPAAIGMGAGSETNQPLSIAVLFGMLSSTLLTLVVVPSAYSLVENYFEKRSKK